MTKQVKEIFEDCCVLVQSIDIADVDRKGQLNDTRSIFDLRPSIEISNPDFWNPKFAIINYLMFNYKHN